MNIVKPEVGDQVSVLVPGKYPRRGRVLETDYHPLGMDDSVKIEFFDEPMVGNSVVQWWDLRWVNRESSDGDAADRAE